MTRASVGLRRQSLLQPCSPAASSLGRRHLPKAFIFRHRRAQTGPQPVPKPGPETGCTIKGAQLRAGRIYTDTGPAGVRPGSGGQFVLFEGRAACPGAAARRPEGASYPRETHDESTPGPQTPAEPESVYISPAGNNVSCPCPSGRCTLTKACLERLKSACPMVAFL